MSNSTPNGKSQEFIKLLIIGDSGVGKSCILSRYCEDKFSAAFFNTIGVDFKTKQVDLNGVKCKMQIWDTAGQQRFRTITSNYYRGANGILIVFDVTSKSSFKDIEYWLSEIQRNTGGTATGGKGNGIISILVGNKCDLVGKREVSEEEAALFAKRNNLEYIEVSAMNASNVDLVFETIGKHILRKKYGANWANVANRGSKIQNSSFKQKDELQNIGLNQKNSKNGWKATCCG